MQRVTMMLVLIVASAFSVSAHTHSHHGEAHAHSHEPAHAKYTKEVNEQAARELTLEEQHELDHHGHSHGEHDHGHAHEHDHGHSHEAGGGCPFARSHDADTPKARRAEVRPHLWMHAIGATLLISAAPCFILLFIPIQDNSPSNGPWLKVLLAFGSGGLLGDAFLHLIPHAQPASSGSHSHSHSHGSGGHSHEPHDMSVGGWVLAGIIAFLVVEKVVRIIRGEDGHGHGHSHGPPAKSTKDLDLSKSKARGRRQKNETNAKHSDDESDDSCTSKKSSDEKKDISHLDDHKHEGIKVAAYLNLVADFAHNFTDGLAIGASFIAGTTVGIVTMVTVLVHEIPHEIGDFAILIQSGYSKRKAMGIQLITAIGALSGCALSLWVADPEALADSAASSWILPFTAGGFIYIATVSVIPELLEQSSTAQSLREIFAIFAGIFMMYLIAMYE